MIKILGCDLSLTGSAFSILTVEKGIIVHVETYFVDNSKNAKAGYGIRLKNIKDNLNKLLDKAGYIDYVAIEKGFTRFNNVTQALFRVVGVVELTLAEKGFKKVEFLSPTSVKKDITGDGKATKEEVKASVQKYLLKKIDFKTLDESDAVAVGISFGLKRKLIEGVTNK